MKDNDQLLPSEENELNQDLPKNPEQENSVSSEKEEIPHYDVMEAEELLERLRIITEEENPYQVIERVKAIEKNFFQKHKEQDELKSEFKNLLEKFIVKYPSYHTLPKEDLEKNLKEKQDIIDQIKELINSKQSLNELTNQFSQLKNNWKNIGPVPPQKRRELSKKYQNQINEFFEYRRITYELRKLNFKKNYQAKVKLCEIVEELLEAKSVIRAYAELQLLHRKWKEIGRVDHDVREQIWQRFSKASSALKSRYHQHYNDLRKEQNENFKIKISICEQVENLANTSFHSPADWNKATEQILKLQDSWKETGFVQKKSQNKIFKRYRQACDLFFQQKKKFYNAKKDLLQQNFEEKTKLCEIAEKLQYSTDWKNSTEKFIRIQREWKEIGAVPRRKSDKIWKRFRTACDYFFDEKNKYFRSPHENQKMKSDLISELVNHQFKEESDVEKLKIISDFIIKWNETGETKGKDGNMLQNQFDAILESWFSEIKMNHYEREITLFKMKIDSYLQLKNAESKLITERNRLDSKIQKLESDLILWQENFERFSAAADSSVLKDIQTKMENAKTEIELLREKINMIDALAE